MSLVDVGYTFVPGTGDLPKMVLTAPDGARVEIYLQGAQVTSWIPARGPERFFLSRRSEFRENTPIRGGIPVIFPQFGMTGPLPLHGLVRQMAWSFDHAVMEDGNAIAHFQVNDNDDSRSLWPHPFQARLTVAVGGNQLAVTLAVLNTGSEPFTFTSGLHTYFSIADIATTTVEGLLGLRYCDAAAGWTDHQQTDPILGFAGEVNRIYFNPPAELRLVEPTRTTVIRADGFTDAVIWNPDAAKSLTMPDLEPTDYQRFVCVEAATIAKPVELAPGAHWQGTQTLQA